MSYAVASAAMNEAVTRQPDDREMGSMRDVDDAGVTISWWADEASAIRACWHYRYGVAVATVQHSSPRTHE